MKVIIIGAVAAGMSAAAKLKRIKPDYEVIVYEKTDIVSFGACGLPYYVGGFFQDSNMMIAREKSKFIESGIDLRTLKEVIDVNADSKTLTIKDSLTEEIFTDKYDKLMIATGASSIMPSLDKSYENLTTLKDMNDGLKLRELMNKEENNNIVILGAGFIGIETIEAAKKSNKNIHLVGRSSRVLNKVFDKEITDLLEEELKKNNIHLHLGETVKEYVGNNKITKVITNNSEIDTDLVVIAIGVKPNTSFLKNTNIDMLPNGAIIVDEGGKTSIKDVYSAGDCATIKNLVTNEDMYVPLATGANKLGRIVGENLGGMNSSFPGSLASSCIKVLDMEAAVTGLTEEKAKSLNIDYKTKCITNYNQTHYYPGREKLLVKLVYHAKTKVILGGQIAGYKDAVQRANVIATAITAGMTTDQLGMLDLCYAPPFATTWDVLNVAGNVSK
ncbi:MAG: CoA-disulfide reductase [Terrisporobacter othiniensis]|uniref:CoA-disulfide reductase n=1 Tax=Terrisporobacter petrolearius TaxID=1460447 RepID=UPI0022E80D39|nr:CoA-disulfide reductase [Terrisporobacter petrolearius]MDU4861415.1 CoA-disulfide reductase [Terrisporobacter othiniensis]MDU6994636.1 CoA-disulfide reductase [Terrisporobacter othiniensis]